MNEEKSKIIIDLQKRIDEVIKDLEDTLKINKHHIEKIKNFKFEYISMDIDHIKYLLEKLKGDSNG